MNNLARLVIAIPFCVILSACDNEREEVEHASQPHVWQGQVDALDKAKEVDNVLKESADRQRQMVDQQTEAVAQ